MTSAEHASQSSKIELGRDPSPPNEFRYTFEDKLEEEMTSAKHASQTSKMELGRGTSQEGPRKRDFARETAQGGPRKMDLARRSLARVSVACLSFVCVRDMFMVPSSLPSFCQSARVRICEV